MLERVVAIASASGLAPIVAVVPSWIEPPIGAVVVINDRAEEGLSRSLRLGIDALPDEVDGAVILLGDQPTVPPSWIQALLAQAHDDRPVVAMRAEGRLGPPVLLRREAFRLVDEAGGDEGLGPVLARHLELVSHVDVSAHAPDVDLLDDLAHLVVPSGPGPGG